MAENSRPRLAEIVQSAVDEFQSLTGKQLDSVTGVRSNDDGGWSVLVDVVELERIPATTSVLATYRIDVEDEGAVRSYERLRRFNRGSVD